MSGRAATIAARTGLRRGRHVAALAAAALAAGALASAPWATLAAARASGASAKSAQTAPPSSLPAGIALGFSDAEVTTFPNASWTKLELARARRAGATAWGMNISWAGVTTRRPPTLADAANPAWSGYDWTATDRAVRAVSAAGLRLVVVITSAPKWAEGPHQPPASKVMPGTWEPSATWFGAFATALLRRYSGSYPDPLHHGHDLPAIRNWEPWNEPNLSVYLSPQWERVGSSYQPESPVLYRALLNAFYAAKQRVAPSDLVAAGATAPFGDPPGGARMQPVTFWQSLLCVSATTPPQPTPCHAQAHFDAVSHHPYPIGPPTYPAIDAGDVSVPDLAKITSLIPIAEKAGTVLPDDPKPLWITEISWDTHPAYDGVGFAKQAQYLEGAIDVLYHEGASVFLWFGLRDELATRGSTMNLDSGVYTRGATPPKDKPKPALEAFKFPFTAYRANGYAAIWGLAPKPSSKVEIQEGENGTWVTVSTLTATATRIFSGSLLVGAGTTLRAVSGGSTSLRWKTT